MLNSRHLECYTKIYTADLSVLYMFITHSPLQYTTVFVDLLSQHRLFTQLRAPTQLNKHLAATDMVCSKPLDIQWLQKPENACSHLVDL